jgi:hypothetical protein
VREFEAFPFGGKEDRVVADDVAAADGVHANLIERAFTDETVAAVLEGILRELTLFEENLEERLGGAGGRVLLEVVVHLEHFHIPAAGVGERAGSLADKRIEECDTYRIVAGPDDR